MYPSVFSKAEVRNELERLYQEIILVPADKACNSIVFLYKTHYYNCISNELGINSAFCNPTYIVHSNCSLKRYDSSRP
jgi:hypothetical protein